MTWNEGYVSEINYTYGFYGELSPLRLAWAIALKALQAPSLNESFTYCELACGRGYSTNLLASCYPQAQFYANDFNPNQILEAKALAKLAGSRNIHFFDDSFAEFAQRDLPEFDFIVLHGIYSWISEQNRLTIIDFIRQKLKVGGIVYISYNALPGWAAAQPIQALMLKYGTRNAAPILKRIDEALNFTEQLLAANANYFVQNPILKTRFEKLKEQNRTYVAHEYFNQEWNSFYFDQVEQELEKAKLQFVGSAHLIDHVDAVNLSADAQQHLAQITDPSFREVVRDFFLNTQFRRDIFARGQLNLTPPEQLQQFQSMRFALLVAPEKVELKQQFPLGEVELQAAIYLPICQALQDQPLTVEALQRHEKLKNISLNNLYQALTLLTGIGYVHPALTDAQSKQRQKSTDAFNQAVMKRSLVSEEMTYLASPVIGTGVRLGRFEQLLLLAKNQKQDGVEFIWQILLSQGKKLIKEGQVLETEAESKTHLTVLAEEFYGQRLPLLNKLGIR